MKKWIWLAILLPLIGCANMSDKEKQTAWIVVGIGATAVIISSSGGHSSPQEENCFFHMSADGSTSTVCN